MDAYDMTGAAPAVQQGMLVFDLMMALPVAPWRKAAVRWLAARRRRAMA